MPASSRVARTIGGVVSATGNTDLAVQPKRSRPAMPNSVRIPRALTIDPSIHPNGGLGLKEPAVATFWPLLLMSAQRGYGLLGFDRFVKAETLRLPRINPFFRDYQSRLLGLLRRVVTNLPVDLFNKLSRCSIQDSANWFPRKSAVILFCCDSDNVPFVLFFHLRQVLIFSHFKLFQAYRDSALSFCLKVNNHENYSKGSCLSPVHVIRRSSCAANSWRQCLQTSACRSETPRSGSAGAFSNRSEG